VTCPQHVTGPRHWHVRHTSTLRLFALFTNPKPIELHSLPNDHCANQVASFARAEEWAHLFPIQKG
jgi:hypothetical protein